jgi:hypothetical protein
VDDEQLIEPTTVDTPLTDDAAPELSSAVSDETVSGEAVSATETAAPEQAATPEFTSIRDWMGGQGFDTSRYQSDEDAVKELFQFRVQAQQAQQQAAYYQQQLQQYQQQLQQHQTPAPQPKVEQKPYWEPLPEFNPDWVQLVERDQATGRLVVKEQFRGQVDPSLPQKVEAYARAKEDRQAKLLQDPVAAIWEGVQQRLEPILNEREQKWRQDYERNQQAQQFMNALIPKLFAFDQGTGQPLIDPTTGSQAFTPWGQAFQYYLDEASQMTPDPAKRKRYAENMANAWELEQKQKAQQLAPPVQPQAAAPQRGNTLRGAARNPSRSGTESAGTPQNAELPFYQKLQQSIEREYGSLEAADAAYSR